MHQVVNTGVLMIRDRSDRFPGRGILVKSEVGQLYSTLPSPSAHGERPLHVRRLCIFI